MEIDLDVDDTFLYEDGERELTRMLTAFAKGFVFGAFIIVITIMLLRSTMGVAAPSLGLFAAEHVSVDTWKTALRNDPYKPEYTEYWRYGGSFNVDLRLLKVFSMKNKLHMDGVDARIATAGWEFTFMMDHFETVKPFYYHHSEHSMDEPGVHDLSEWGYPATDKFGLQFCAIGCKSGRK